MPESSVVSDPALDLVPVRGHEPGKLFILVITGQADQPENTDHETNQHERSEQCVPHCFSMVSEPRRRLAAACRLSADIQCDAPQC